MNDIRIPDWQSRGRGFVSLILQSGYTPGVYNVILIVDGQAVDAKSLVVQ